MPKPELSNLRCRIKDPFFLELELKGLEDKVQKLSEAAEQVHQNTRRIIEQKTGIYVHECVILGREMEGYGSTLSGSDIIFINQNIASLDPNSNQFINFRLHNAKGLPEDLLTEILTHEYAHKYFDQVYRKGVLIALDNLGLTEKQKILKSIDEGFAYWFAEAITGIKSQVIDSGLSYKNHYYSIIIDIYDLLKKQEQIVGIKNTAFSLISIVNKYLSSRVQNNELTEDARDKFIEFIREFVASITEPTIPSIDLTLEYLKGFKLSDYISQTTK